MSSGHIRYIDRIFAFNKLNQRVEVVAEEFPPYEVLEAQSTRVLAVTGEAVIS